MKVWQIARATVAGALLGIASIVAVQAAFEVWSFFSLPACEPMASATVETRVIAPDEYEDYVEEPRSWLTPIVGEAFVMLLGFNSALVAVALLTRNWWQAPPVRTSLAGGVVLGLAVAAFLTGPPGPGDSLWVYANGVASCVTMLAVDLRSLARFDEPG